ncbi:sugar phosphate isomerase family [Paenibacillus gyeongsangnamensis]|uniref:hypothetical protein n=1 Tax=Paenibacillus gyeongsangnamensis TaxID=3388067 RepID=UPI003908454B
MPYKKSIARAAVSLVKEGDTVFIDAVSTKNQIADLLVSSPIYRSLRIALK